MIINNSSSHQTKKQGHCTFLYCTETTTKCPNNNTIPTYTYYKNKWKLRLGLSNMMGKKGNVIVVVEVAKEIIKPPVLAQI